MLLFSIFINIPKRTLAQDFVEAEEEENDCHAILSPVINLMVGNAPAGLAV